MFVSNFYCCIKSINTQPHTCTPFLKCIFVLCLRPFSLRVRRFRSRNISRIPMQPLCFQRWYFSVWKPPKLNPFDSVPAQQQPRKINPFDSTATQQHPANTTPPRPQPDKRKQVEPGRYNGKEPVHEYLLQFELTARRNGWDDAEMATSLLCVIISWW